MAWGWQNSCRSRSCNYLQNVGATTYKNFLQLYAKKACKKHINTYHTVTTCLTTQEQYQNVYKRNDKQVKKYATSNNISSNLFYLFLSKNESYRLKYADTNYNDKECF